MLATVATVASICRRDSCALGVGVGVKVGGSGVGVGEGVGVDVGVGVPVGVGVAVIVGASVGGGVSVGSVPDDVVGVPVIGVSVTGAFSSIRLIPPTMSSVSPTVINPQTHQCCHQGDGRGLEAGPSGEREGRRVVSG
ncbi:MAG: hypothetical protein DRI37_01150 [Chloroflexi bacterium]|nr:MAG: hypothetical protein DRI37_01150 [Chloroflexota bacterium]